MEAQELTAEEYTYISSMAKRAAQASVSLRLLNTTQKNEALKWLAELLEENRGPIKVQNSQDVEDAQTNSLSQPMIDRLILDDKNINSMIQSVEEIRLLPDPVGEILDGKTLPNGLKLEKIRIPIGVLAVIYESRPNVTIDVAALALKSSNAVILRGGKEALMSNKLLSQIFQKALLKSKISPDSVQFIEKTRRAIMSQMLKMHQYIDLVVPRGGEGLIKFVTENSLIPVVKHDKGVCHIFVDESADFEKTVAIILNSKTQKPSVCNAVETLLLSRQYKKNKEILLKLIETGVRLHGDSRTKECFSDIPIDDLTNEGYHKEYLEMSISIKCVDDIDGAIKHILEYSSSHTEAIMSENFSNITKFQNALHSAGIFINCSTRFHDGGQFGFGAEVGISTGKLHSRGPMGIKDLTTFKYHLYGNGQLRI